MPNNPPARDRILRAALRIIGDSGVSAVTNRRIAEEAGVSLGSITYHFATQRDLLRESLALFVENETCRFAQLATQYQADSISPALAGQVVSQAAAATAFDSEHIASFELYIQAGRDPELRGAAAACFAAYDQLAASILRSLGIADTDRVAPAAVALITGLQLRRLATGAPGDDIADALLLLLGNSGRPT
ncbi:TetR/AcrR family transcriptional regulator [Kitasatospora sp. NPDC052896]|uniref:TetR/AcrR family transcriptional regulator n=1 Tax=Kitasatospora sp. NPDC052896 TaxID=3364061 RepID=UPI0037CB602A